VNDCLSEERRYQARISNSRQVQTRNRQFSRISLLALGENYPSEKCLKIKAGDKSDVETGIP
jgi:hypothetical protein